MGRVVRRSAVQAGWKRSWRYQRRVFNLEINRNSLVDAASPSILVRSRKTPSILIGLRVVDVLFPVAKGQRELIIGDRQSGKSTI
jgi:F-type H+-transporting ATPase subunit alpha